ncbi:MAG: hypothetical protein FJ279_18805, partial [Planctomycetes bacterium]|nr:hypothetical protein [Planctomycetota bacterium]
MSPAWIACVGLAAVVLVSSGAAQETLYNGIRLPSPWPPRVQALTHASPPMPPYLLSPPGVVPIDVGRQLLVDDFLIEHTTLTRTFHLAEYHGENPVLKPDKPWEQDCAMAFSDGLKRTR